MFPLNKVYKFSSGSHVRSILNIMGIYKISSKIYGSKNFYNVLNAVINSLLGLKNFLLKINVFKNILLKILKD
ncbi:hypothetical protein QUR95_00225 [Candidatus Nasuia deltocephalinicola]|nr:hypothetical protein QUR95_00225 [Candidatus Nasuia deltocephalinicola]